MEVLGYPTGTGEIVSSFIACLASLLLFVSYPPLVTWKLSRRINTQRKFHPYPIVSCYWSNMFWFLYIVSVYKNIGYPPTIFHTICLSISMDAGLIIPGVCIYIFLSLFNGSRQKAFFLVVTSILAVNFVNVIILFLTMIVDCMFSYDGPIAFVLGIIMYASPLPIIMDGRKDDVSDYMPSWLCFTLLLNSLAWTIVAFNVPNFDLYITVTNVIGTLLALSQLVLIHGFLKLSLVVISGVLKFLRGVSLVLHWAGYSCLAVVIIFQSYVLLIGPMMMSQA